MSPGCVEQEGRLHTHAPSPLLMLSLPLLSLSVLVLVLVLAVLRLVKWLVYVVKQQPANVVATAP